MRKKHKVGDIVAIPLPNGKYAFGKLHNDSSIGVYSVIAKSIPSIEEIEKHPIVMYSGVFDTDIVNGEWEIIGNKIFESEDKSWPPAQYIQDIINQEEYRIYYRGEMKPANKEEIAGLEEQAMRKPEQLVQEISKRFQV